MSTIDIVFDGPPSHESGRFVETEDENRASISIGDWVERDDGYWALRIGDPRDIERLQACIDAALALHFQRYPHGRNNPGFCADCIAPYPCPTVKALRGRNDDGLYEYCNPPALMPYTQKKEKP